MYSAILSRNPGNVDALKCALYGKMRRADWGGALLYARRLRDAERSEVEWRLMLSQLHELKGDLADAERQYREILTEEPLLVRALHVGIAHILFLIYSVAAILPAFVLVDEVTLLASQLMWRSIIHASVFGLSVTRMWVVSFCKDCFFVIQWLEESPLEN